MRGGVITHLGTLHCILYLSPEVRGVITHLGTLHCILYLSPEVRGVIMCSVRYLE